MMLIDKGYYDYDFKRVEPKLKRILFEDTVKDEVQTKSMLARFGIGAKAKELKDMNIEELQEYAMNDMNNSKI